MTYTQAQERYGLQDCSTVLNWLLKYDQPDWHSLKQRSARGGIGQICNGQRPHLSLKYKAPDAVRQALQKA